MEKKSLRFVSMCLPISLFITFSLYLAAPPPAKALIMSETVETITLTRNPVEVVQSLTQSYILIKNENAVGTIVLFMGGNGKLVLPSKGLFIKSPDFLVRSRYHFAAEGFHVVVMDAAIDFLHIPDGLIGQRTGSEHLSDIAAVIDDLRQKLGEDLGPICLVGMSFGTISVGAYAAEASSDIDCIVLISSVTQPSINRPSAKNLLDDVDLESVDVSSYVVAHKNDMCLSTPPSDANVLKSRLRVGAPKVKVKIFDGGTTTLSDECSPLSAHGYFGIEPKVVNKIGRWIRKTIGE